MTPSRKRRFSAASASAESANAGQSPTEPANAATCVVGRLEPEVAADAAQRRGQHLAVRAVRARLELRLVPRE